MSMLSRRDKMLEAYRAVIGGALSRAGDDFSCADYRISLADLVPGIAFREIWPLAVGQWTPLKTYKRDKQMSHDFVPRKVDRLAAEWLMSSIFDTESLNSPATTVFYLGDSESDLILASNLATTSPPGLPYDVAPSVNVKLYLYDPDGNYGERGGVVDGLRVQRLASWQEMEARCRADLLDANRFDDNYLLVDIDRTLLLPRGMCDQEFSYIGEHAFGEYAALFLDESQDTSSTRQLILSSWLDSEAFPPFVNSGSPFKGDQDVRAIGALGLCSGIAPWSKDQRDLDIERWSTNAEDRVAARFGDKLENSPWNYDRLRRQFHDVGIALQNQDCSLLPIYREKEEDALLSLSAVGKCKLNGHVVKLISAALDARFTPIAYSDRPGSSVGLHLRSYFKSRPSTLRVALIETPLPLCFD